MADALGVVAADLLNVRLKPELKSVVVAKLPHGTKVDILGTVGDFYEISAPDRTPVYVSAVYLRDGKVSVFNENFFRIVGGWLIRGSDIKPMLDENPDAAYYNWRKLDENNEADKKLLADLWCASETIDGKEINSNEVFK